MYTRITKTGGRQYLQLVESFRNDRGQVRVRVVANLGRLDKLTAESLDPLINGLNRAIGRAEMSRISACGTNFDIEERRFSGSS